MKMSFKSRKLKGSIQRISDKAKNLDLNLDELQVFGVSKEDGITITGKDVGKDLGQYFYFSGQKFAYNPYRVNIGSIGLSSENFEGLMSPAYIIFEVDETIYPEFLLLYLKSNVGLKLIRWYGDRGGVRSSLRISDLEKVDFPDISYEEQKTFYNGYQEKEIKVERLLKELDHQETLLTQLRESILQDAIQGKLTAEWRKQNPNAEPASELLKRIKAEKEQLIKEKKIRKEKPLPKIKVDEIPFEIPESWEWCRIRDLFSIQNGYAFKSSYFTSKGIRLLRNINIGHGIINWGEIVYYPQHELDDLDRFSLNMDDIVISLDRPLISTGLKMARVRKEDLPAMLLQRVGRISSNDLLIDSQYLYYWLSSSEFIDRLNPGRSNGVPHISTTQIESFVFPFPPVLEQKRIVSKLTNYFLKMEEEEKEIKLGKINTRRLLESVLNDLLGKDNTTLESTKSLTKKEVMHLREIIYNSKTLMWDTYDLVKEYKKIHAEDLWKMSKFPEDIDQFYAELKKQIEEKKSIKESSEKGYLELA